MEELGGACCLPNDTAIAMHTSATKETERIDAIVTLVVLVVVVV